MVDWSTHPALALPVDEEAILIYFEGAAGFKFGRFLVLHNTKTITNGGNPHQSTVPCMFQKASSRVYVKQDKVNRPIQLISRKDLFIYPTSKGVANIFIYTDSFFFFSSRS